MSRLGFIARHPKRALSALATLCVASGLVVGSGAFFQSTDTNVGSSVNAGTIDLRAYGSTPNFDARTCAPLEGQAPTNPTDFDGCYNSFNDARNADQSAGNRGSAIFNITDIQPGQVVTRHMLVKNFGTLPANIYALLKNHTGSDALFNALTISIQRRYTADNGNYADVYTGKLSDLENVYKPADPKENLLNEHLPLGNGEAFLYRFMVKLPETNTDQSALMGQSVSMDIDWVGRDLGAPAPAGATPLPH